MAEKTRTSKAGTKTVKANKPVKAAKPKVGETGGWASAPKKTTKPGEKLTTFTLKAPQARQVCVAGSFNDWSPMALERNQAGIWTHTMRLEPGEHEYRFIVDGVWWDDPLNTIRRSNELGTQNCIRTVEA
jgi:1,4-alpha-glucan branching enzyme